MKSEKSITVIFLMYVPYGFDLFERFIGSYLKYQAGIEHKLVIVFKGINHDLTLTEPYNLFLKNEGIQHENMNFEGGFDINAYFFVARNYQSDFFYFFNSSSVILADNWLLNSYKKISDTAVGVVASTASFQSYYSTVFISNDLKWDKRNTFKQNLKKIKLLIKAFVYWRFLFKPFPNPHFRTNAFMIRNEVLKKLKCTNLNSKFNAYRFESGRNGMTNQIKKIGYSILLIDKYGNSYDEVDWAKSKIFWSADQEDLVVSDNQTNFFTNASPDEKRRLTLLAWGK